MWWPRCLRTRRDPFNCGVFDLLSKGEPEKLPGGKVKTSFQKSVPMSTYLVCFAVHKFKHVERTSASGIPVSLQNRTVYKAPLSFCNLGAAPSRCSCESMPSRVSWRQQNMQLTQQRLSSTTLRTISTCRTLSPSSVGFMTFCEKIVEKLKTELKTFYWRSIILNPIVFKRWQAVWVQNIFWEWRYHSI